MSKKFTLIFDYDDFLQQKKRPPIFTNQRAHDAIYQNPFCFADKT